MVEEKKENKLLFWRFYPSFCIVFFNTVAVFILINILIFFGRSVFYEPRDFVHIYEPFTQFAQKPEQRDGFNITREGYRKIKDQGPWPPNTDRYNVFVFGGSTTLGVGVRDDQAIPSYLQEYLRGKLTSSEVNVYNFGRTSYFSAQETILFVRLLTQGKIPNLAIFVDGLNEFFYETGEPKYTNLFRKFMSNPYETRLGNSLQSFLQDLPVTRVLDKVAKKIIGDRAARIEEGDVEAKTAVIKRYLENKRIIEAIGNGYGVDVLFVWQPVPTYKYDLRYHAHYDGNRDAFEQHVRSGLGYRVFADIRERQAVGGNFLWLGDIQENSTENLYVDRVHYTSLFSRKIANLIGRFAHSNSLCCEH